MVTIRLQRRGKIHEPFFHIVAADSRKAVKCGFIERLGYYDPKANPSVFKVDPERLQYWYSKGANLSGAVSNIVKKMKVDLTRSQASNTAPKAKKVTTKKSTTKA